MAWPHWGEKKETLKKKKKGKKMADEVSDQQSMLQLYLVSVDLNGQRKPAAATASKPDPGPACTPARTPARTALLHPSSRTAAIN